MNKWKQLENIIERVHDCNHDERWKISLEFRHPSWYTDDINLFADKYQPSIVLHNIPASRNMALNEKASFVYLRFHGHWRLSRRLH
ncbi:MAG: DUF72 domain-containing protein [Chitinophagaceae bacterium]|nr:DUF72 domain-containing protein [Chitinophagaceae bacterium]